MTNKKFDTDSDEYDRYEAERSQQIKMGSYRNESCGWGVDFDDEGLDEMSLARSIERSRKAKEAKIPDKKAFNSYNHAKRK